MEKAGAASCAPSSEDDGANFAHLARPMPRRISIVGASGSGKSHLAKRLSQELGIPLFKLDRLRNGPSGARLSDAEFSGIVADLAKHDEWIIDGHYRSVRQLIWDRSTSIVWLDYPLGFVLFRIWGRYLDKRRKAHSNTPRTEDGEVTEFAGWFSRGKRMLRLIREPRDYARLLGVAEERGCHIIRVRDPGTAENLSNALAKLDSDEIIPCGRWEFGPQRMIELFGPPGSGKSTIGGMLARDLGFSVREQVVNQWRLKLLPKKSWYVVRGFLNLPVLFSAIRFAFEARITDRSSIDRLARMVAKDQWLRSRRGGIILEQGYLQDIWSLLAFNSLTQIDRGTVTRFLKVLYRGTNHTFIYVDIDPDTATRRIVARRNGASRLDRMAESEISERLNDRAWVTDLVYSAALAAGLSITRINGTGSITVVRDNAMRALTARGFCPATLKS